MMIDTKTPPPVDQSDDELRLDAPPGVGVVSTDQAAASARVDDATAEHIRQAVNAFVESLSSLEPRSPDFERKVDSIRRLGNEELRRSSEASERFLQRPTADLQHGPLADGSQVSAALLSLRRRVQELEPGRHLTRGGWLQRLPFGDRAEGYFRKYQSAQAHIEAIIQTLYRGQDELLRDNAGLEQEKTHLWVVKGRLEQYVYMAAALDRQLSDKVGQLEHSQADHAHAMKEDVLFYVRQKRQDLLTQLAVTVQGYLSMDLIRKNNIELIKGVERATTTTVSALRTAVISALALGSQRQVLDQISALNSTTGRLIEGTSSMLRQQTEQIHQQAAGATINMEQVQAAFNNVYATIDSIDRFKLAALETMRTTIDTLSAQLAQAQVHIERARASEASQSGTAALSDELNQALPRKER